MKEHNLCEIESPYCKSDFWRSVFLNAIRAGTGKWNKTEVAEFAAEIADRAVKEAQQRGIVEK